MNQAAESSSSGEESSGGVPVRSGSGLLYSPLRVPRLHHATFRRVAKHVAGVALLCAAALKARQLAQSPIALARFGGVLPAVATALISWEIFLGLWLISGALPQAARRAALGCFSMFACYTLYEALAGKTDCGCFGQVHVNPWYTFPLDIGIVLALVFLAKPAPEPTRWSKRRWPVAAAAGIGLAAGVAAAWLHPKVVSAANGMTTADSGKLVILEPHHWLGHRLPVLAHIVSTGTAAPGVAGRRELPLGRRLAVGNWTIMFYHAGCGECRATIPVYEQLAQSEVNSGRMPHVVFVRVPSGSGIPTRGLFHSPLPLHATLDATREWFAQTPIIVRLHNGTVTAAVTGTAAMDLPWRRAAIR